LAIDCTYANYNVCPSAAAQRVGSLSPKGDGKWGQADLAGNVWEWALDWYGGFQVPCNDCANLTTGTVRLARAGSFANSAPFERGGYRLNNGTPTQRVKDVGVRCARAP
jgi:formylglycine-generating enzyme required for sulfatase activity